MYVPYTHHVAPAEMAHAAMAVRQGVTAGLVRWVLAASLAAAVIGLLVARILA